MRNVIRKIDRSKGWKAALRKTGEILLVLSGVFWSISSVHSACDYPSMAGCKVPADVDACLRPSQTTPCYHNRMGSYPLLENQGHTPVVDGCYDRKMKRISDLSPNKDCLHRVDAPIRVELVYFTQCPEGSDVCTRGSKVYVQTKISLDGKVPGLLPKQMLTDNPIPLRKTAEGSLSSGTDLSPEEFCATLASNGYVYNAATKKCEVSPQLQCQKLKLEWDPVQNKCVTAFCPQSVCDAGDPKPKDFCKNYTYSPTGKNCLCKGTSTDYDVNGGTCTVRVRRDLEVKMSDVTMDSRRIDLLILYNNAPVSFANRSLIRDALTSFWTEVRQYPVRVFGYPLNLKAADGYELVTPISDRNPSGMAPSYAPGGRSDIVFESPLPTTAEVSALGNAQGETYDRANSKSWFIRDMLSSSSIYGSGGTEHGLKFSPEDPDSEFNSKQTLFSEFVWRMVNMGDPSKESLCSMMRMIASNRKTRAGENSPMAVVIISPQDIQVSDYYAFGCPSYEMNGTIKNTVYRFKVNYTYQYYWDGGYVPDYSGTQDGNYKCMRAVEPCSMVDPWWGCSDGCTNQRICDRGTGINNGDPTSCRTECVGGGPRACREDEKIQQCTNEPYDCTLNGSNGCQCPYPSKWSDGGSNPPEYRSKYVYNSFVPPQNPNWTCADVVAAGGMDSYETCNSVEALEVVNNPGMTSGTRIIPVSDTNDKTLALKNLLDSTGVNYYVSAVIHDQTQETAGLGAGCGTINTGAGEAWGTNYLAMIKEPLKSKGFIEPYCRKQFGNALKPMKEYMDAVMNADVIFPTLPNERVIEVKTSKEGQNADNAVTVPRSGYVVDTRYGTLNVTDPDVLKDVKTVYIALERPEDSTPSNSATPMPSSTPSVVAFATPTPLPSSALSKLDVELLAIRSSVRDQVKSGVTSGTVSVDVVNHGASPAAFKLKVTGPSSLCEFAPVTLAPGQTETYTSSSCILNGPSGRQCTRVMIVPTSFRDEKSSNNKKGIDVQIFPNVGKAPRPESCN